MLGKRSNGGIAIALALVGLIALIALVVGIVNFTWPTASPEGTSSVSAIRSSTFTSQQAANAKKNLCDVYQVAARSVKEETNGTDVALARISLTNAAGMLYAAIDNPALGGSERDAARRLADAYRNGVAIASAFDKDSSVFRASVDEVNRADAPMATICR